MSMHRTSFGLHPFRSRPAEAKNRDSNSSQLLTSVVRLVNTCLYQAIWLGASHLYFQIDTEGLNVLYRQDGVLVRSVTIPNYIVEYFVRELRLKANIPSGNDGGVLQLHGARDA